MNKKYLYGTVVPIVTPFDENGDIDLESVQNLTEFCINHGTKCLYPCGSTGEMLYMSVEERKKVLEAVLTQTKKRIPVYAQVGAMTAKDTINLAKHAVEEGADGIGVVTPSYFSFSDDGLVDYYVKISNSVPNNFPVYLYGIPQNAVNDLSYEAVKRIAEKCPNVVGIKYSYPNIMRILQFMTIRDNTFSVLVGSDALYQNVVSSGGDGSVCASAMIYSEYFEALYNALDKTDTIRAIAIQRKINELVAISARKCGIHAMKVILKNEGVIKCDTMRAPMDWLSEQDKEELLKDIADAEYRKVTI